MGTYFDSIVLPADLREKVRAVLVEWMGRKGFELQPVEPLFSRLDEGERGAVVAGCSRGTVVLLSHPEETERFVWELKRFGKPVLRLWLVGSDVWGYHLIEGEDVIATFSSNENYYGPGKGPAGDPKGDPGRVAGAFGVANRGRELRRLQRRRALFAERIVEQFCAVIGIPGAATQFAYVIQDEAPELEAMQVDRLLFVRAGSTGGSQIRGPLRRQESGPLPVPRGGTPFFVRAIVAVARLWFSIRNLARRPFPGADRGTAPAVPRPPWYRREGNRLISDRYRCSIALPEGARFSEGPPLFDALAFEIAGVRVALQVRRRSDARGFLYVPAGASVQTDEMRTIGDLLARRIRYSMDGTIHHVELIETSRAVYAIVCQSAGDATVAAAIDAAAGSFQAI